MPGDERDNKSRREGVDDEGSEDVAATLEPRGASSAAAVSPAGIALGINGHELNPKSQMPGGEDFKEDASRTNYIIIQFTKLPSPDQEKTLRDLRVQFCRKILPSSWLAKLVTSDLSPIRELPFVVYVSPYDTKFSLHPGFEAELRGPAVTRGFAAAVGPGHQDTLHNVYIVLHPRARTEDEIRSHLIAEFGIPRERLALERGALHAQLTADEIIRVAEIDDVYRVEQIPEMRLHNHLSHAVVRLPEAQASFKKFIPETKELLDGTGENIVICDTGLDKGDPAGSSTQPPPSDFEHPCFHDRVLYYDNRANDQRKDDKGNIQTRNYCEDFMGHGTHVAGIALGRYGPIPEQKEIGINGPGTRLDGVAPGAGIVVQNIVGLPTRGEDGKLVSALNWGQAEPVERDPKDKTPLPKWSPTEDHKIWRFHMEPYFGYPTIDVFKVDEDTFKAVARFRWRARIHSSSWGPNAEKLYKYPFGYDYPAQAVDFLVSCYPEILIIRAAGNEGDNIVTTTRKDGQILSWASAKNGITVGACYNDNQYIKHKQDGPVTELFYAYQPSTNGGQPVQPYHVAHSSSRGPTIRNSARKSPDPHRDIIKPDVVAPGIAIYSVASRASLEPQTEFGVAPQALDPPCAFMSGTSMAAPMVAGCAALLRQALRISRQMENPSAALLKALIINGAVDLSRAGPGGTAGTIYRGNEEREPIFGSGETEPVAIQPAPSDAQGWGRLDIADSIDHVLDLSHCEIMDIKLPKGAKENSTQDKRLRADQDPPDARPWKAWIPAPPAGEKGQRANFKATLAWTDKDGEGLQNQLALSLVFDDAQYKDKNIAVDWQGERKDNCVLQRMARNNVQKLEARDIEMRDGEIVGLTVTVTAVNITERVEVEGKEGTFYKPNQAYALVWKVWYSDGAGPSGSGSGSGSSSSKGVKEKETN